MRVTFVIHTTSSNSYAVVYATKLYDIAFRCSRHRHCSGSSCLREEKYWFISHPNVHCLH